MKTYAELKTLMREPGELYLLSCAKRCGLCQSSIVRIGGLGAVHEGALFQNLNFGHVAVEQGK